MAEPIFLFAVHNHQPWETFPRFREGLFATATSPSSAPWPAIRRIRFTLHFSGPLWNICKPRKGAPGIWSRK